MRGFIKGGGEGERRHPWSAGVAEFSSAQIADIVAWLRSLEYAEPTRAPRVAVLGSAARGKELYDGVAGCVGCHGADGQGGVGPALGNAQFLSQAPEGFLIGTMVLGRAGTEMRRFSAGGIAELSTEQFMDIAAYVRTLAARESGERWRPYTTTEDRVALGAEHYQRYCVSCHGEDGRGGYAPELNNPEFLAAASDGFLVATIARGRKGTPMRAFGLGPSSMADLDHDALRALVGYMRSWQTAQPTQDETEQP
jgi:mono/diheme cytochrome c family protein